MAEVNKSSEEKAERKPKISRVVAGVCALLVAAAAGAAVVADKAFKEEDNVRIYSGPFSAPSKSTTGRVTSAAEREEDSSAAERDEGSSAAESESDSSAVKETKATAAAVVYEYPQDINLAPLECFLAVSGINKTAAEGLIAYRRRSGAIHNFEELLEIYGIGERTLEVIKEHFFISEDQQTAYAAETEAVGTAVTEATTSEAVVTLPEVTVTTEVTSSAEPEAEEGMKPVDINSAGAGEIAAGLRLSPELAEEIVKLRGRIGRYRNLRELLYIDGISKEMLNERKEYILTGEEQR